MRQLLSQRIINTGKQANIESVHGSAAPKDN
jgi:hypothetical protein